MMRACILALMTLGCTRVWGFEEPVLADAGPAPVVREPCFENDKVEVKACEDGDSSRVCTPDGWSSWTACAKAGFRDLPPAPIAGRIWHSAVWTGDELIIWGGRGPNEAYIVPLGNVLLAARRTDAALRRAKGLDPSMSEAIIIADSTTPYRLFIEVLFTLGQSEFGRYHLMVIQSKTLGGGAG